MSYDFTKLSQVDINNTVEDTTYSLVVNGDEVQKTVYTNLLNNNYTDYSNDFTTYLSGHSGATPIDYILTLTPMQTAGGVFPNQGFIIYDNYYYLFIVYVNDATLNINEPIYWFEIKKSEIGEQILTCYTYNSLNNNPIETIEKSSSGTNFLTTVSFDNINNISINNNASIGNNLNISGGLSVDGGTELNDLDVYGGIQVSGQNGDILIDGKKIEFSDSYGDASIKYAGHDALLLFGRQDENTPVIVHGIDYPESNYDSANKKYVDDKDSALQQSLEQYIDDSDSYIWNELSTRINSVISQTDTDNLAALKISAFTWDSTLGDFVNPTGGSHNIGSSVSSFIVITPYNSSTVEFLYAYYTTSQNNKFTYIDNVTVNDYSTNLTVAGVVNNNQYMTKVVFVYLVTTDSASIPELTALRGPYDYSGIINDYDSSTTYHAGDYCYYPSSTTGRLYICTATTSGSWDSSDWGAVEARDSIEKGFEDLNDKIDNKGFSLDTNGILNLG